MMEREDSRHPLPNRWLAEIGRASGKEVWRAGDRLFEKGGSASGPSLCSLRDFMAELCRRGILSPDLDGTTMLRSGASWRPTQDIVRFDDALYDSLIDSEFDGRLPADMLRRLPAWSVYFETPRGIACQGDAFHGFFATMSGDDQLSLVYIRDVIEGTIMNCLLPLDGDLTEGMSYLREGGAYEEKEGSDAECGMMRGFISASLSLVLYVCSYGFGDGTRHDCGERAAVNARKAKGRLRICPAQKPSFRTPGTAFAERIREAARQAEGSHSRKRPHLRRGHWHGHWIGKRDARELVAKWHLPVMVALGGQEEG